MVRAAPLRASTATHRRYVMSLGRLRAVYGININRIVEVLARADAMHAGLSGDPGTCAYPPFPHPACQGRIVSAGAQQQAERTGVLRAHEKHRATLGLVHPVMIHDLGVLQPRDRADLAREAR